jgi:hypothetical protein
MGVRARSSRAALALAPLVVLLLPARPARAAIAIAPAVELREDTLRVELTFQNRGDSVRVLQPSLHFRGREVAGESLGMLPPGGVWRTRLEIAAGGPGPGRWPYRVEIAHAQDDGYPVHTTIVDVVTVGTPAPTGLALGDVGASPLAWSGTTTLRARVENRGGQARDVRVSVHPSATLAVLDAPPAVRLDAGETRQLAVGLADRHGVPGHRQGVFVIAESDGDGVHDAVVSRAVVPIVGPLPWLARRDVAATAAVLVLLVALGWHRWRRPAPPSRIPVGGSGRFRRGAADAIALVAALAFTGGHLPLRELLGPAPPTGGDLAGHYQAAVYLHEVLAPAGRVVGWDPGAYAGFPLFQFYFPLPFVLVEGLARIVTLPVAFKLVSILGLLLLPPAAYLALRLMQVPFPGPALGALGTLCVLFLETNSVWGGNILSTLTGELTYSLGLALGLVFLGSVRSAVATGRGRFASAALLAATGLSHGYALLWAALASLLELVTIEGWWRRLRILVSIHVLALLLMAVWLVPLLWYTPWTTAYDFVWTLESWRQVLPPILWPAAALALASALALGVSSRHDAGSLRPLATLWGAGVVAFLLYLLAHPLHLVNIRFMPFAQLAVCLAAGAGLGTLLARAPAAAAWPLIGVLLALPFVRAHVDRVPYWMRYCYAGFEQKRTWAELEDITARLRGSLRDPRVAWEHAGANGAFGTIRTFESLPLLSGRSTLQGLYVQSSATAPFVELVQSEISERSPCLLPAWGCSVRNLDRGIAHLRMFNVSQLVVRSPEVRRAARNHAALEREAIVGEYELYRLRTGGEGYAIALSTAPVLVRVSDWKEAAYRWFKRASAEGPVPVFAPAAAEPAEFGAILDTMPPELPRRPLPAAPPLTEHLTADRIVVHGARPGHPLLVRISDHPRWRALTGERIWLAGPSFMLVFPRGERVELVFDTGPVVRIGLLATAAGLVVLLLGLPPLRMPSGRAAGAALAWAARVPPVASCVSLVRRTEHWSAGARRVALGSVMAALALAVGAAAVAVPPDIDTLLRRAQAIEDGGRVEEALALYAEVVRRAPLSSAASSATYLQARIHFRAQHWEAAEAKFREVVDRFSETAHAPPAQYHIGWCRARRQDLAGAIDAWDATITRFGETTWARSAAEALGRIAPGSP